MHIYLVWKDRNCDGKNPEWLELDYNQFKTFKSDPQNLGRYYIDFPPLKKGEASYTIEATFTQFREWKQQKNHHDYLIRQQKQLEVSLDGSTDDDGSTLYDVVPSGGKCVEDIALDDYINEKMTQALGRLENEEREVLNALFFKKSNEKSEAQISRELGLSTSTLNYKKQIILKKIKKFLDES